MTKGNIGMKVTQSSGVVLHLPQELEHMKISKTSCYPPEGLVISMQVN
jgi:hypothetical protein